MISVQEAQNLIRQEIQVLAAVTRPLLQTASSVLAQDIFANTDIPAFEQSSVDGYAIRFADKDLVLKVRGEMAAGTATSLAIEPGQAVRIFTGAPLPVGADTVVMQENVIRTDDTIQINDPAITKGVSVRPRGSEIKARAMALPHDTQLSPAAIGFLAGIGIGQVPVYSMPSVSILVTGNELQSPGQLLSAGQVYESNSYSLTAALREAGVSNIHVLQVPDNLSNLKNQLESVLEWTDLVLITGGVSVGDYDFVVEAAARCEVRTIFHRVSQKPGKPLFFGMKGKVPVFGLPGNPSSVLSCFYNYVLIAVEQLSKKKNATRMIRARMKNNYNKPGGLTHFLKGRYEAGLVEVLTAQASYQLSSFAAANCLVILAEEQERVDAGDEVTVLLLPGC